MTESTKPTNLILLLLLGLLIIVGQTGVFVLVAGVSSMSIAIGLNITLTVVILVGALIKREPTLMIAAILSALAGIMSGLFLGRYLEIRNSGIARNISVAQAPQHKDAVLFYFKDGTPRPELIGEKMVKLHKYAGGETRYKFFYYCAAPLTGPDWRAGQPVPAWVVCTRPVSSCLQSCAKQWKKNHRAGLRESKKMSKDFRAAIHAAETAHGLKSHPDAPALFWTDNPEQELERHKSEGVNMLLYFVIAWVVILLLGRFGIRPFLNK